MTMQIRSLKPVLPNDDRDPVGAMRQVIRSYKLIRKKMNHIEVAISKRISEIPRERVAINKTHKQTFEYRYLVDAAEQQNIGLFIQQLVYDELLDSSGGVFNDFWFLNQFIDEQYEKATLEALQSSQNLANAEAVGEELSRTVRSIQAEFVLMTAGYQRRINLVKNRLFEEMQGLSDEMKKDLGGVLGRGMAAGHGVNRIKKEIRDRIGVAKSRAERIARTEINNAYRTAYWAETDELNDSVWKDSGFVTRMLWYSALVPNRTRRTHAIRHGEVYTTTEVREFYSVNGNAINCLCTQVEVLVRKSNGEVININIVNSLKKQRESFLIGVKAA